MGAITLTRFGGILPRTSERLVPDNAAQVAVNCRLSSGELEPFNAPAKVYTSAKTGPLLAIHRIDEAGAEAWLAWAKDADVVKAPLFGTGRWCFTGDGEPRITTRAAAVTGAGNNYPAVAYTLGTPKPVTAPTATPSGGVGAATNRYYGYTFYADWDGLEFEGAISPLSDLIAGKVDDTWAITGMDAAPPNNGTATGVYGAGVTTFTDTAPHWLRAGEEVVIAGVTLAVTEVSGLTFKVAGDYSAATTWARKASFPGTIKRKLYRSTGTTGQFQLVAEGITATTYNDTLTDSQIPGDELISASWEMPPTDLKGLIVLPSGALLGFTGNKARLSEPYQPHAWPTEYEIVADHTIVAAAHFGTGVVLATESRPFIIQGIEPGQMSGESWNEPLPCLSKRSAVSLGDMVLYASHAGIIGVNGGGARVWSIGYFTDREFLKRNPATMISAVAGRRLFVLYESDNGTRALIFNLNGDDGYLIEAHFDASELFGDETNGKFYFAAGSAIYEFDPSSGYAMQQDWMSKEIVLPAPMNLGAAKVNFERAIDPAQAAGIIAEIAAVEAANTALVASGKVNGGWNMAGYNTTAWNGSEIVSPPSNPPENTVTFMLYADGAFKCFRSVTSNRVFRLPSDYKAESVSVRVLSQCKVKSVEIGPTPKSIGQTGQA